MTIKKWLESTKLNRLDAILLLEYTLKKPREYLLAHNETEIDDNQLSKLDRLEKRVLLDEPLAYIIGKKEFFGYDFIVTPDVLIPRPETENLVELVIGVPGASRAKILDLATGSGCIAVSIKKQLPNAEVTASDIDQKALRVAVKNSEALGVGVNFIESDLFSKISKKFSIIVSNPPYVDKTWTCSPSTKFEPQQAIFAEDGGLFLVKKIITESKKYLVRKGFLALEVDKRQHSEVIKLAQKTGLTLKKKSGLALLFQVD